MSKAQILIHRYFDAAWNQGRNGLGYSDTRLPEHRELTEYVFDLEKRLAEVEAKLPRWIPVSDSLPKECEAVLICIDDNKVSYGYHFNGDWYAENIPLEAYDNIVTLWMPLPEPPNNEENAG